MPKRIKSDQPVIYQLKIVLAGTKPPLWRRVLVDSSMTLFKLHQVIQVAMGWENAHLHMFQIRQKHYGEPENDMLGETLDERKFKLWQVIRREKEKFQYRYDFGDSWDHNIIVEKITTDSVTVPVPICTKAVGACPPEDCGGLWGYYNMINAINDPKHPEHEEMKDWIGDDYDSKHYDIEKVNQKLGKL